MLRAHGPDCKASWHARRRSVRGLLPASSAQVCLACCSGTDIGGTAGFASIIGLLLQVMLVVIVARLIFVWWQRRNMPAPAYAPRYNIAPTVSAIIWLLTGWSLVRIRPREPTKSTSYLRFSNLKIYRNRFGATSGATIYKFHRLGVAVAAHAVTVVGYQA
jgi:hypothetical protein